MSDLELKAAHEETREAWNVNATYWDEFMGEGNDFVETLIWPPVQRLLALQPGARVLEIACGNGLYARKLANLGVEVVATDFAPEMIAHAQARPSPAAGKIEYEVLDATDEAALLALGKRAPGEGPFDAAICMMGLMDMSEIAPLMRALARLLRPGGRFMFRDHAPVLQQRAYHSDGRTGRPARQRRNDLLGQNLGVHDVFGRPRRGTAWATGAPRLLPSAPARGAWRWFFGRLRPGRAGGARVSARSSARPECDQLGAQLQ